MINVWQARMANSAETYKERYDRLRRLSLDEVFGLLGQLAALFVEVSGHYPGSKDRFLSRNDGYELDRALGELLPLGLNDAVQAEILGTDPDSYAGHLAFFRVTGLATEIKLFLSTFENTGVRLIDPGEDLFGT